MKRGEAKLRREAQAIFRAALAAADVRQAVRRHLSIDRKVLRIGKLRLVLNEFDRVFLIAAGKAALEMAAAVETIMGPRLSGGITVTKCGHAKLRSSHLQVFQAGHPIPDRAGPGSFPVRFKTFCSELNARDLLLVAISGGASALLPAPAEPITLSREAEDD